MLGGEHLRHPSSRGGTAPSRVSPAMISPDYPLASWFLVVSTSFFLVVIALPLLFAPLTWARWYGWKLPEGSTDLTVYLGRCLGGVAFAVIVAVAHGIPD